MQRASGFTVLEAVAAIVVLGLAIPPMLWGLREAHAHRASQVLASRARWLAAEKLEDVIADRHSVGRGYGYVVGSNYPAESPVSGWPGFSRAVSVVETGPDLASAGGGYKKVTCSVMYSDGAGAPRTVSLSTVVTDYTP